jgi:hypothetical protein
LHIKYRIRIIDINIKNNYNNNHKFISNILEYNVIIIDTYTNHVEAINNLLRKTVTI